MGLSMRKFNITRSIIWIFIGIGLIITLFPFAWVVSLSLRVEKEVFTTILFPEHVRFRNYIDAWIKFDFTILFKNSVVITLTSVAVTVFVSALAGYGFAKFRLRASNLLFHLILSGIMVPPIAIVIPLFVFMRRLGLFNSYPSIIFPYIVFGLPIATLIFKTYIQNLDNDILDAARIDGCGEFRIFLRILLPIIKPAIATVTIFTFMANWNEFLLAVIFLQDKKLYTLPLGMAVFVGQYSAPWQLIGSGVVISIIPVLLLFFILQNQFIRGLTAGALK
jgi:ABC-type glycerol-3-phosphate transport system permease component